MFVPTPFSVSVVLFCNSFKFTNLSLWTFFSLRQSLCAYFICLTVFKLYFTFCESALSNFLSVFQLSLLDFLYLSVVCLFSASASFVACICHLNVFLSFSLFSVSSFVCNCYLSLSIFPTYFVACFCCLICLSFFSSILLLSFSPSTEAFKVKTFFLVVSTSTAHLSHSLALKSRTLSSFLSLTLSLSHTPSLFLALFASAVSCHRKWSLSWSEANSNRDDFKLTRRRAQTLLLC